MHIGRDEKASKTECIMFHPPRFLDQDAIEGKNDSSSPPLVRDTSSASAHTPIVEHASIPEHAPSEPKGPHEPPPSSQEVQESPNKKKKRRKKINYTGRRLKTSVKIISTTSTQRHEERNLMMAMLNSRNIFSTWDRLCPIT